MNLKIIKDIYESIKRTKTEFSNESFSPEKLDILKENITTEDGRLKFLTSDFDLEEVVFYNYALPEESFENLEYIVDDEKDLAQAFYIYIKRINKKLENIYNDLNSHYKETLEFNHNDSDILLNLLYEKNDDSKLYFYETIYKSNVVDRKDFFEILNEQLVFTEDFTLFVDPNEGYLKISFPVKTFVNMLEFSPLSRSTENYSLFANKDNTIDKLILKDEEIAIKGVTTLNEEMYDLVIRVDNIYNISTDRIKIKVGDKESANSLKKGFVVLKAKLDAPNNSFRIVNSENKNIAMYLIPQNFAIESKWLFEDLESEIIEKNFKKLVMNVNYDDSLIDNNILIMFESSASIYRGIKILKVWGDCPLTFFYLNKKNSL